MTVRYARGWDVDVTVNSLFRWVAVSGIRLLVNFCLHFDSQSVGLKVARRQPETQGATKPYLASNGRLRSLGIWLSAADPRKMDRNKAVTVRRPFSEGFAVIQSDESSNPWDTNEETGVHTWQDRRSYILQNRLSECLRVRDVGNLHFDS